ncbi:hypothetical protein F511_01320 [Dorcoceras hygrometricum]|uniref:DUF4378 domain-containing protein n=1 Tax=Dorcoceras hygrometricum TaxID=472368 RepID=A0A2Z7D4I0_9LAMI|nr:hypothetical protein F511_01320 [Dorcoceras hygrometricum]
MPNFLGEFLQEEQEPFSLEVYLLERGCSGGTTSLDSRSHFLISHRILKRCGIKKQRSLIPNCSTFVKAVLKQLGSVTINLKIKNLSDGDQVNTQENASSDKLVSNNSGIVFNPSVHCVEESSNLFLEEEVDADAKLKWRSVEDNRQQLSPVSVLEVAESDELSPLHYKQCNIKKTTQAESSASVTQFKSKQATNGSAQLMAAWNPYTQHIRNKRALRQTKQLLIDCVREVIENYRKQEHMKKVVEAEELWKLVCENVWLWSQDSIHETNVIHLVHYDFLTTAEDWRADFEEHKKGIWMDVGDAILEDVINEIVAY